MPLIGRVDDPFSGVAKEAMIEALKADAKLLVEKVPTAHDLDLDRVTGHSLRRSGWKHLAKIGISLELIQYMARHSSQAVLGYVEDALGECPSASTRLSEHLGHPSRLENFLLFFETHKVGPEPIFIHGVTSWTPANSYFLYTFISGVPKMVGFPSEEIHF